MNYLSLSICSKTDNFVLHIFTSSAHSSGLILECYSILIFSPVVSILLTQRIFFTNIYTSSHFCFSSKCFYPSVSLLSTDIFSYILPQSISPSLIVFYISKYFPVPSISPSNLYFKTRLYLKYFFFKVSPSL